jgi:glutaredoxin-like protein NrdH
MNKKITLYTLPNCMQCTATKIWLDNHKILYETVNLLEDNTAYEYVTGTLGYKSAPIITIMEEKNDNLFVKHWNGYNPEALKENCK